MPFGYVPLACENLIFVDIKGRVSYLISNSSLITIYRAGLLIPLLERYMRKSAICFIDGELKSTLKSTR